MKKSILRINLLSCFQDLKNIQQDAQLTLLNRILGNQEKLHIVMTFISCENLQI